MVRTVNDLIESYQGDADSPFRKLRYGSRVYYGNLCKRVAAEFGTRQIGEIKAREILHWYDDIALAGKVSMAHALVGMLRTLVNFGASLMENEDCEALSDRLHKMRFKMAKPRTQSLTFEQANIIREIAYKNGKPSIALAQAFQFECTFRQKDVIGEYVPLSEPGISDVIWRDKKWLRGIRWEEIDSDLKLRHITSKRQKEATINLRHAQMVLEELDTAYPGWSHQRLRLPVSGPIIICETYGAPWLADEFRRHWRMFATEGGIPNTIRNMDSRSGAITEALMAGAGLDQVRKAATHSDAQMTQRYSREDAAAIAEVMQIRANSRSSTNNKLMLDERNG